MFDLMRIVLADRPSADSHTHVCVRVVMRVSDDFRLYGSNRWFISRRVRLLSTDENFSGVFRIGDVCSVRGGLCSIFFCVCSMLKMILAELKSNSLYDYDCLETPVKYDWSLQSSGETRCLITVRGFTI